jgi:hypothetical protein
LEASSRAIKILSAKPLFQQNWRHFKKQKKCWDKSLAIGSGR